MDRFIARALLALCIVFSAPALANERADRAGQTLQTWYQLVLELVRHTATYSPPVASRAFAYLGVTAHEVAMLGDARLTTLAGQLNGLTRPPSPKEGQAIDVAVAMQAALAAAVRDYFGNTGPTGQRAMAALEKKLRLTAVDGLPDELVAASEAYGRAVAAHVFAWSLGDGGAAVENMGFPLEYKLVSGPAHWVPTSLVAQQQFPLLPNWGANRTFAMPSGATCGLPQPPAYSEEPGSAFFNEVSEVYKTVNSLTAEQKAIARFWSDDPMLSPTPPGHWISIALQVIDKEKPDLATRTDVLARLGVTLADAFIGCWHEKFVFDLVRPVTVINRLIDPKWQALLNTPPFPEYPSGHSTQSGAAAVVLAAAFGDAYAFDDATHTADNIAPRRFASFRAAAEEAGISRLYGGIHFRSAIERGLDQGYCIGAYAVALKTRVAP